MVILLKMPPGYSFEIQIEAEMVDGKMLYRASPAEAVLISYFDSREVYAGDSIGACMEAIANGLKTAIAALRDEQ